MLTRITPKKILPFMKTMLPSLYKGKKPVDFSICQGRFMSEPERLEPSKYRVPILTKNNLEHYLNVHFDTFGMFPILIGFEEHEYKALKSELHKAQEFKAHSTGHLGLLYKRDFPHEPHPQSLLKLSNVEELESYITGHKGVFGWKPLSIGLQKENYQSLLRSDPKNEHHTFSANMPRSVIMQDVEVFFAKPHLQQFIYLVKTKQHANLPDKS